MGKYRIAPGGVDAGVRPDPPGNLPGRIAALGRSVDTFAEGLRRLDPAAADRLQQVVRQRLPRSTVTLTFAGHFKAGKSSMLNAALGRQLLPMNDLPETGVVCVLRAGDRDSAVAVGGAPDAVGAPEGAGRWEIACELAAIRRLIAIRLPDGTPNESIARVERLEVTLAESAIPPGVCWLDSPGISDTPDMNERALQAAREADVLLWVLNSKQLFSLVEQAYLADYIAERGPQAVIFIINAFLPEDTPAAWQAFGTELLPAHLQRIRDYAAEAGFPRGVVPETIAVAARAIGRTAGADGAGDAFGAAELRALLAALDSPAHARVRNSRLRHLASLLRGLVTSYEPHLRAERMRYERAARARAEEEARLQRRARQFALAVEQAVNTFQAAAATAATTFGSQYADSLAAAEFQGDTSYLHSSRLTAGLQQIAGAAVAPLLAAVAAAAQGYGQPPLSAAQVAEVRRLLTPAPVAVAVPSALGARPSALGAWVSSARGAVASTVGRAERRTGAPLAAAQAGVRAATAQAVAALSAQREPVLAQLLAGASAETVDPDDSRLRAYQALLQSAAALAAQATALAEGGPPA